MTREEAISVLNMVEAHGSLVIEAKDMAIKALEQEPCEKVLDKIKVEVERERMIYLEMNDIDWLNGCDYVLSVIDKYKAESEE